MFTLGPPLWGGETGDPYWSYVKTLLHFDGNTTDSSTAGVTYTNSGGATLATSGQLYGSGALDCRPSNNATCSGSSAALVMGAGDFCIECWFRDENQGTKNQYVWTIEESSASKTVRVYAPSAGNISCDVSGGGPVGSVAYSYNVWIHSAVTRSGNNWTHWINGVAQQTWTNATFSGNSSILVYVGKGTGPNSGVSVMRGAPAARRSRQTRRTVRQTSSHPPPVSQPASTSVAQWTPR